MNDTKTRAVKPLLMVAEDGSIIVSSNSCSSTVYSQRARKNDEYPEYISIKQACEITGYSRWTISRWIKAGLIRASKNGKARSGRVRIVKASLYALLDSQEIPINEERKDVEK